MSLWIESKDRVYGLSLWIKSMDWVYRLSLWIESMGWVYGLSLLNKKTTKPLLGNTKFARQKNIKEKDEDKDKGKKEKQNRQVWQRPICLFYWLFVLVDIFIERRVGIPFFRDLASCRRVVVGNPLPGKLAWVRYVDFNKSVDLMIWKK